MDKNTGAIIGGVIGIATAILGYKLLIKKNVPIEQ